MSELTTKELFSELQSKLIIDLKEDEILCPECKGLRFVLTESNGKGFVDTCGNCYIGKLEVCKHCGKANKSWCDCKGAYDERHNAFSTEQSQKDAAAYQKAEKINYTDYDGYYLFGNDERVKTLEDLEEWIRDKLLEGEELPEYLWAVEGQPHFSIDIHDVISDRCEGGYEDMYSCLGTESPLLTQAQELITQWENEQSDSLNVYSETYKKAVIIKDLVEEIRKEIVR
jgi:hypothetical protein